MLEHIRTNSISKDGRKKCEIFENELESARKNLSQLNVSAALRRETQQKSTTSADKDPIPPKNVKSDGDKSPVRSCKEAFFSCPYSERYFMSFSLSKVG